MKNSEKIDRRQFLKVFGTGTASAAAVAACSGDKVPSKVSSKKELGEMTYRTDNKGNKVSLLGYGCMRWPERSQGEEENPALDQESINELVDYALEHGINYFDTAPVYGWHQSEKATGIALGRHPRESYYIATKLSTYHNEQSFEYSKEMYENSFKELGVDYIDYYLIHNIGSQGNSLSPMGFAKSRIIDNGILDFLLKEREAGRIRNLGFSFHGDQEVFDYMLSLHDQVKWDFVQIQMNYVDWKMAHTRDIEEVNAEYLYGQLAERDIPVIIMEPLLGGNLAKLPDYAVEKLLSREPNKSLASWAFRFCGSHPLVLTVLSGMTYMEHLKDNLLTFSPLEKLSEDDFALLEDIAEDYVKYPLVPCTACQYCMPCPYGIDIPGVFAHYNKCINEGTVNEDTEDPEYAKDRKAFLTSLDRNVKKLQQADHCIGCGQCLPKCPQHIQIPEKLRRIDFFTEKLRRGDVEWKKAKES